MRLQSAHVEGQIDFTGTEITNTSGPAVEADSLRTNNMLLFRNAKIRGGSGQGSLDLRSAHIGGQIDFDNATITNDHGPAVTGDSMETDSHLFLRRAKITACSADGAILLIGAHIGGQIDLHHAIITNDMGAAVNGDSMHVASHLFAGSTLITGNSDSGAVRLAGTHVVGLLAFSGARITNAGGPAIQAQAARLDDALHLDSATLSGSGEDGVVDLSSAHVEGPLTCRGLVATTDNGPRIDLRETALNQRASVEATLICPRPDRPGRCPEPGRIQLDTFTYPSLRRVTWKQWLHLIRFHTDDYRPQPYQQLAAVERTAGHDHNARHILIAQQEDLRRRNPEALGGRLAQWIHAIWGVLGGYGYRAARLGLALIIALTLSGPLGWVAGQVDTRPGHLAAERVTTFTAPTGTPCSFIELVGLGIDRGLPLGTTGLRTRCDLDTATRWGQGFTIAIWCIQIAVWALATLAIASHTGLIRKPA